ncbi:MAG: hypothetical protein LBC26_05185, partial [Oscillospiraceae bacterium]|nr:hypothetical protein [Oscillospiraceae bacterium]
AGNHSRIRQTFRLAMITSVVLNVVFTVTGLFFPIQITRLFMAATPEVLKLAPNIMRTYFLTFLCMGVTVLSIYYLQSMMRAKLSMTIALLRGFVVSGLLLYMLPLIMGMSGVWWAMPISEGVVAVIALSHIKHMRVTCV